MLINLNIDIIYIINILYFKFDIVIINSFFANDFYFLDCE